MKIALFLLPHAEKDIDSHCEFWGEKSVEKALAFDQAVLRLLTVCVKCLLSEQSVSLPIQNLSECVCGLLKDLRDN